MPPQNRPGSSATAPGVSPEPTRDRCRRADRHTAPGWLRRTAGQGHVSAARLSVQPGPRAGPRTYVQLDYGPACQSRTASPYGRSPTWHRSRSGRSSSGPHSGATSSRRGQGAEAASAYHFRDGSGWRIVAALVGAMVGRRPRRGVREPGAADDRAGVLPGNGQERSKSATSSRFSHRSCPPSSRSTRAASGARRLRRLCPRGGHRHDHRAERGRPHEQPRHRRGPDGHGHALRADQAVSRQGHRRRRSKRTSPSCRSKVPVTRCRPSDLGNSNTAQQGDGVLAIGNALALAGGPTVTEGIVSAQDRSLTATTDDGTTREPDRPDPDRRPHQPGQLRWPACQLLRTSRRDEHRRRHELAGQRTGAERRLRDRGRRDPHHRGPDPAPLRRVLSSRLRTLPHLRRRCCPVHFARFCRQGETMSLINPEEHPADRAPPGPRADGLPRPCRAALGGGVGVR